MEVQPAQSAEEIKRLQRCINDLVSVITLPATWTGGEPSQIVGTLLDVLLNILPLDLVYVRLKEPNGEPPIETVRVARQREPIPRPHDIGEVFNPGGGLTRRYGLRGCGILWERATFRLFPCDWGYKVKSA